MIISNICLNILVLRKKRAKMSLSTPEIEKIIIVLGLVSIIAVTLPVLIYFLYQKYQVRIQIRNVPYSTIFNIDLDKVKKNLEIQSMVYNFLIVIMMIEIITNVFIGIEGIVFVEDVTFTNRNRTKFITVERNRYFDYIGNLPKITTGLVFPILCLFLIVLRRAFINFPYKKLVWKYSVYILIRLIVMLILFWFHITFIIGVFMQLLLGIFDLCVYNSSSRAFYVLLKGRRDEAFYHSSRKDYLEKKRVANQFFYTQVSTHFLGFLLLLFDIFFFSASIFHTFSHPNFFELMTFGYFPKFLSSWHAFAFKTGIICERIEVAFIFLIMLYIFSAYLFVSISILVKLFIRRKKFNHVNDWITRPLMETYRSNLEERRIQERPPFIQAFRSGIFY